MDLDAALSYIADRRRGVLVTLKRDGRPQLSNISYRFGEDGVIRISVTADRAKTANLRRDPRASLYVTAEDFWSYVVIEASAELGPVAASPDDSTVEQLITLYRSLSGEHPDWDDFRAAMVRDRRLVVTLRPERAYGLMS